MAEAPVTGSPQRQDWKTLADLIDGLSARGEAPAVIAFREDGSTTWSYARLADAVRRVAAGLQRDGLERGERVLLCAPNGAEWVTACLAILACGAVAVPLDPGTSDAELARVLVHSGVTRGFVSSAVAARLAPVAADRLAALYLVDASAKPPATAVPWRSLLADAPFRRPSLDPGDGALLLYTSGTTGVPKGVPLSHGNLVANLRGLLQRPLVAADERVLIPLPLHHAYPFTVGLLGTLASGAAAVFPADLSGPQIAAALRGADTAAVIGVPGLYAAVLTAIEGRLAGLRLPPPAVSRLLLRLSIWFNARLRLRLGRRLFRPLHARIAPRLRLLACGGAQLDAKIARRLEGLGWEVLTGYGLTETSPIVTFNPPGAGRLDTTGLPIPAIELRIAEHAPGEPGEIQVRGASVFAGYWRNPDADAAAFTEDGWFRTGDLGTCDADGRLRIVGRLKELIVLPGGRKLFPEDVEAVYAAGDLIREIAVLETGGRLVALVVPDPEAIRTRGAGRADAVVREQIEALSATLRPHERVAGVAITREKLPRTLIGKLRRHALPALYEQALAHAEPPLPTSPSAADAALLATPDAARIWQWLEARFSDRHLQLDMSPQIDLGIDSLRWIELTLDLQGALGIALSEAAIAHVVTLRDLLHEALAAAGGKERPAIAALTREQERWLAPMPLVLRPLSLLLHVLVWLAMHGLFRLEVRGTCRLPPTGGIILTPNHASYLDPFALAAALGFARLRRVYWAGWTGKLFTGPLTRVFSRAAQVVPVDPDRGPAAGLAIGEAVLCRGRSLVWFPEGRRSPTGALSPFLPGIGVLAERTGAMLLPVRISGSYEALPATRTWPRLGKITVAFGTPLDSAALAAAGAGATSPVRIASALRDAVAALPTRP